MHDYKRKAIKDNSSERANPESSSKSIASMQQTKFVKKRK
jgi:hypothetical protein